MQCKYEYITHFIAFECPQNFTGMVFLHSPFLNQMKLIELYCVGFSYHNQISLFSNNLKFPDDKIISTLSLSSNSDKNTAAFFNCRSIDFKLLIISSV